MLQLRGVLLIASQRQYSDFKEEQQNNKRTTLKEIKRQVQLPHTSSMARNGLPCSALSRKGWTFSFSVALPAHPDKTSRTKQRWGLM